MTLKNDDEDGTGGIGATKMMKLEGVEWKEEERRE